MNEQVMPNNEAQIAVEMTADEEAAGLKGEEDHIGVDPTATPSTEIDVATDLSEVVASQAPPAEPTPAADSDLPATTDDGPGSIHDLKEGLKLKGKVKTTTDFGAFVDLGIAQDGLVHISQLARGRVEKVSTVVSEGDEVTVWVKKVDKKRGRISLTMLKPIALRWRAIKEGAEVVGQVTRLESYGAFVDIGAERDGLVHVSELTHDYIGTPEDVVSIGQTVQVKVLKVDRKKRQVDLSMKALRPPPAAQPKVESKAQQAKEEIFEEEETPTAMALAMQAALGSLPTSATATGRRNRGKRRRRQKQKEINKLIYRTLENQKN
jgi:small subunit ribosomal protein S1